MFRGFERSGQLLEQSASCWTPSALLEEGYIIIIVVLPSNPGLDYNSKRPLAFAARIPYRWVRPAKNDHRAKDCAFLLIKPAFSVNRVKSYETDSAPYHQ